MDLPDLVLAGEGYRGMHRDVGSGCGRWSGRLRMFRAGGRIAVCAYFRCNALGVLSPLGGPGVRMGGGVGVH